MRPLHDGLSSAEIADEPVVPLVVTLLAHRGPATVTRLIIAVVVRKPVDAVFRRWALTNVSIEVYEPFLALPPITDNDSAPAIVGITLALSVPTSIKHRTVAPVFRGVYAAHSSPVGDRHG